MNSRAIVKSVIEFNAREKMAIDFREKFGTDMRHVWMQPSPDDRPSKSSNDEWGSVWENIGISDIGEVKQFPLKDWKEKDKFNIPDITRYDRWRAVESARAEFEDIFLVGMGVSIYERIHFIRGLENTWADIHEERDELCWLLDILTDMNIYCVEKFKDYDLDAIMLLDDWGLQDRLMISPTSFREIWKPRYARIFEAAHKAGLKTFLHSCGHIVDILDDFIEVGLDVIQMDQQMNMGLDNLSKRFAGKITFYSPIDIQAMLPTASEDEIRDYCRKMHNALWRNGGFMPKNYPDNVGAGFSLESEDIMCDEFMKIGREMVEQHLLLKVDLSD